MDWLKRIFYAEPSGSTSRMSWAELQQYYASASSEKLLEVLSKGELSFSDGQAIVLIILRRLVDG